MTEIADAFAIARAALDWLESRASLEPERVRATLVRVNAALWSHGRPQRKAGKKLRGLGFTFDEAHIMASLPPGTSIETAAREYWQNLDEDKVDANIRKLYRHKRDLENVGETF